MKYINQVEAALQEVYLLLGTIENHYGLWKTMSEDTLWRELVACILGSRVRFEVAISAVRKMETLQLFSEQNRLRASASYEQEVMHALAYEQMSVNDRPLPKYPFPARGASHIRRAANTLYDNGSSLGALLNDADDVRQLRRCLASNIAGIGPKQASLFLRNICYSEEVAILDVHVLDYMKWIGLLPADGKPIRTMEQYETIEDSFVNYSISLGHSPDRLDLAVWVVMRVVKEEFRAWL